ncbi:MAG TPA: penicillin-binding transpeptidase domain-containing protein [Patescibacteria group bacterium]|nr:penicillin-binding transpeptidase domain-containing protein [Patescibacteria group bacterium]
MDSLASQKPQSWLSWFLRGILIVGFLVLFARLFETQIVKGGYFRVLSEENRIRHIPIPAPRGRILARGGEVLAGNLDVRKAVKFKSDGAVEITDDLTGADDDALIKDFRRTYPLGDKFSHGIGYLSEIGPEEVGRIDPACPEKGPRPLTALVGKTGLEGQYQCLLEGIPGEELVEVDTAGKKIRTLGRKEPVAGRDVKTTIDYGLQVKVAEEMSGKMGAAIVTDAKGEILAFYSEPSFDPNLFINKTDTNSAIISSLLNDSGLPFFNRVIGGTFHPGSVFKLVTATAALEEKVIDRNFRYVDTGVITVGTFSYTNWYFTEYGRTEGEINLPRAIARSTDTFFYKIGEMAGPGSIAKWASAFGLNRESGVDISGEVAGLIPTPDWKEEKIKERWYLGDTYHMAIGQGYVALTPIGVNSYVSAIATGKLCQPHFLLEGSKASCDGMNLETETLRLITEGMKAACEPGGTAYTFFDFADRHNEQEVACKTGTAEVGLDGEPHAWFVFFTPIENPQIVATILVEEGGQGSQVAGPIARKIADYYFAATSPLNADQ